jgi:DNA-binding HxlR family transcriptional regulator
MKQQSLDEAEMAPSVHRRSYRQACNIARSLDLTGDRWTLLVVRELLTGPKRYGDLLASLSGIGTNLLATRLRQLEADGLLDHERAPGMRKTQVYHLTEQGRWLEPVLMELVRFGTRAKLSGNAGEYSRPGWAVLSAKAAFRADRAAGLNERYEFRIGDEVFYLGVKDGRPDHGAGQATDPAVVATMSESAFDRLMSGRLSIPLATVSGEVQIVSGYAAALERCELIYRP